MHQDLRRLARDCDPLQERARAAALLVNRDLAVAAMRESDGVGATLGDSGQEGTGRDRPVDGGFWREAVAGNSTHNASDLAVACSF